MKYSVEMLQEAVDNSESYRGVMRYLGLAQDGGNQTHMRNRIRNAGIDVSHFTGQGWQRGKPNKSGRKTASELLVLGTSNDPRQKGYLLKRSMLECGVVHECILCSNVGFHNGKSMTLEVDHINGKFYDNRIENLRFLCPNCHSQCDTNKSWKNSKP